jgi:hypothetical protein
VHPVYESADWKIKQMTNVHLICGVRILRILAKIIFQLLDIIEESRELRNGFRKIEIQLARYLMKSQNSGNF